MGPNDLRFDAPHRRRTRVLVAVGLSLALAVAVGGCDNEENGSGPDGAGIPALVVVTPAQVVHPFSLDTVRFTAEAFDVLGDPVADAEFTWTSSDPDVATVAAGLAATQRAGRVEIQARAGDAIGRAELSVSPGTALENECMRCHTAANDYRHVAWGFDAAVCTLCHVMDAVPHSEKVNAHETASGGFALPTDHADLVCTACHDADTFAPLFSPTSTTECIACHQSLYDAEHAADAYPMACPICHTTAAWLPASFDHDSSWFPIFSGRHQNRWFDCAVCHTNPVEFTEFTCFNCHAHNQTSMDNKHASVSGYAYDSAACYTCHPGGNAP